MSPKRDEKQRGKHRYRKKEYGRDANKTSIGFKINVNFCEYIDLNALNNPLYLCVASFEKEKRKF